MSKRIYLHLIDTSVRPEDPRSFQFVEQPSTNDIAGLVLSMARANESSPEDIRLFVSPTKREWDTLRHERHSRTDWSLYERPVQKKEGRRGLSAEEETALENALGKVRDWLKKSGLSLACDIAHLPEGQLGEYEAGSVFGKEILIRIDIGNIRATAQETSSAPLEEIAKTVYHEVGHAVVEQLDDWATGPEETIEFIHDTLKEKYPEAFDVLGSDEEETVAEDFARGMYRGTAEPLRMAFDEVVDFINEN